MIVGVGVEDTRREFLGTECILSRLSFEIVFYTSCKEIGIHATENSRNVSAVSWFQ